MHFGTDTYRGGAIERIGDAAFLLNNGRLAGAVYFAGVAVECMLRSLVWLEDKQFDERHDLRRMAVRVENLGLLRTAERDEEFVLMIHRIALRWHDSLRFAANDHLARMWSSIGPGRAPKFGGVRGECRRFVDECTAAVRRCEVLWQRRQKPSSRRS